jgi:F-type H+-transporting ATPase subunit a
MAGSPLDQFKIKPLYEIDLYGYDISFTNSSLFMVLAVLLGIAIILPAALNRKMAVSNMQALGEAIYYFVSNLMRDTATKSSAPYFPFVFSIFMMVLVGNLLGMLPYSFTFTSHIFVTFILAMIVFIFVTIIGLVRHGLGFFNLFLPHGTPWYIAPILIPIEVLSYLLRPVTLSVRLFANMMAGHILLKVFISLITLFFGLAGFAASLFPFIMTSVMIGFEFFVACIQAFIFTLLTCVYLKDAIHLH